MPKENNNKKEKKDKKEKGDKKEGQRANNNNKTKAEAHKAQVPYKPQPPKETTKPQVTKYNKNLLQKQTNGVGVTGVKRKQESNNTSDKRPNKKQKQ